MTALLSLFFLDILCFLSMMYIKKKERKRVNIMAGDMMESIDVSQLYKEKSQASGIVPTLNPKTGTMEFTPDEEMLRKSEAAMLKAFELASEARRIGEGNKLAIESGNTKGMHWQDSEILRKSEKAIERERLHANMFAHQVNPDALSTENYGKFLEISVKLDPNTKTDSIDEQIKTDVLCRQITELTPEDTYKKFYTAALKNEMGSKRKETMLNHLQENPEYANLFTEESIQQREQLAEKIKQDITNGDPRIKYPTDISNAIDEVSSKTFTEAFKEELSKKETQVLPQNENKNKSRRFDTAITGMGGSSSSIFSKLKNITSKNNADIENDNF